MYKRQPEYCTVNHCLDLKDCHISELDILNHISDLKENKSIGPDGIPCSILKNFKFLLVKPLKYLFNLSLQQAVFPEIWKRTYITPVYKSGDRSEIINYTPITIVSHIPPSFLKK